MVQQQSDQLAASVKSQSYRTALWTQSPTAQVVHQLDGTILDVNQAFANLIDRTVIETLGLNIWNITPKKYHDFQAKELAKLEREGTFQAQHSFLKANGQPVAVSLAGVKIELEENNLVLLSVERATSPTTVDTQVGKSIVGLQKILDELPMAIFWKDRNLNYLGANKKFSDVAGFDSPQSLIGKNDYDGPWKREEAEWFRECDLRVMDSGISEPNIIEPQQQSDGSQRWLKTSKMVLRDVDSQVIGILGTFEDITEKIELEKELKNQTQNLEAIVAKRTQELTSNKARFEKLVVNVPGAMYQFKQSIDGSFSFPYISADCEEICEISAEEIMHKPELLMSQIHPADISNFEKIVQKSAETLEPKHWEGRLVNPLGKVTWIQTASKPEKQADGSIVWDGLMIDISDRKQAEQELRESQQLLRLIFDTLPQRIFWKDTDLKYLGCNQLFARDAGLESPEEIIGKDDFELSWHKSAALYRADDEIILAGGAPKINYEEAQIQSDGNFKIIKTNKLALKDKSGRIVGLFGSYEDTSDINEQKQQTENAQNFLEKAFDSISNPIFVKDTNHRWVLVNEAYCKFVGYSKAEMLGKSEPDFYSQEQADIYWAKDELVMLSGTEETDEEPFTDSEGNEKILVTKKSCFYDLDGKTYLLGMIVDIYDV